MSDRLQNLERAVTELSPVELREFAAWFLNFDQTQWEQEIEADSKARRLDFLRQEAQSEGVAGNLKDL